MIEIHSLSFHYPLIQALSGISLAIEDGEMVGIVGPNGSGKSTLLKLLARILTPTGGEILVGGKPLQHLRQRELARLVSFVPQDLSCPFSFEGEEFVTMGRAPYLGQFGREDEKDRQAVRHAMEATGTWGLRDRVITELSGGEFQRLLVAQALAQETCIMLLDEPTAHLDINFQVEVMDLLFHLNHEKRTTILIALHDLNLASQYCGRLFLLSGGGLVKAGTPEEVLTGTLIQEIYGVKVEVHPHPITGKPVVFPIPKSHLSTATGASKPR